MKNRYDKIAPKNAFRSRAARQQEQDAKAQSEESSESCGVPESLVVPSSLYKLPEGDACEFSSRLVIQNIAWERVTAEDLYVLCQSFLPLGGELRSVRIQRSRFGHERLQREAQDGPDLGRYSAEAFSAEVQGNGVLLKEYKRLTEKKTPEEARAEMLSKNPVLLEGVSRAQVRLYELDKQLYYYAVVELDGAKTAKALHAQINGIEFESVGCILDVVVMEDQDYAEISAQEGFDVPEDQGGKLKASCTERPVDYVYHDTGRTGALQTKPQLEWDLDDKEKIKDLKRLRLTDDVDPRLLAKYFDLEPSEGFEKVPGEGETASGDSESHDELSEEGEAGEEGEETADDSEDLEEELADLLQPKAQTAQKTQLKMTPTFANEAAKAKATTQEETPFQRFLRERQADPAWEFRQKKKKGEEKEGATPKEVQNIYKKLMKQLQTEDDPRKIKFLVKRKQKLTEKYPRLAELDELATQVVSLGTKPDGQPIDPRFEEDDGRVDKK